MIQLPHAPRPKVRVISTDDQILLGLSQCLEPHFKIEWVQASQWPLDRSHSDVQVVIHTDPQAVQAGQILLVSKPNLDANWIEVRWPTQDPDTLVQLVRTLAQQQRHARQADWGIEQEVLQVLQTDQQAGRAIQSRMLPSHALSNEKIHIELGFFPSLLLSGDFADFFQADRPSRIMVLLADVAGHGVSSAMVTVVIKNLINRLRRNMERGSSFDLLSPSRVLERINNELQFTALGKHATVFCALIDSDQRSMTYSVAGHTPMPILAQDGQVVTLQGKGRPVGLFDAVEYSETVVELSEQGYHLCLASDGVLDLLSGQNTRERTDALAMLVGQCDGHLQKLTQGLSWHDGTTLPDDVTLLMIRGNA